MTYKQQAEIIAAACRKHGLDGHITQISRKSGLGWAEKIAVIYGNNWPLPVKNSVMYCDTLDMCFFFGGQIEKPYMAYAGYVTVDSKDITQGKLKNAFDTALAVLETMKELAEEADND